MSFKQLHKNNQRHRHRYQLVFLVLLSPRFSHSTRLLLLCHHASRITHTAAAAHCATLLLLLVVLLLLASAGRRLAAGRRTQLLLRTPHSAACLLLFFLFLLLLGCCGCWSGAPLFSLRVFSALSSCSAAVCNRSLVHERGELRWRRGESST